MNIYQLTNYLNCLFQMSSSLSNYIGLSYTKIDCYSKQKFKEHYNLKELNIDKTSKNIETALLDWFRSDKKIIERILYCLNMNYVKIKSIYYPSSNLLSYLNSQQ